MSVNAQVDSVLEDETDKLDYTYEMKDFYTDMRPVFKDAKALRGVLPDGKLVWAITDTTEDMDLYLSDARDSTIDDVENFSADIKQLLTMLNELLVELRKEGRALVDQYRTLEVRLMFYKRMLPDAVSKRFEASRVEELPDTAEMAGWFC
jgi:hypothetical protein